MCNGGNSPLYPQRQEAAQFAQPVGEPDKGFHLKNILLNGKIVIKADLESSTYFIFLPVGKNKSEMETHIVSKENQAKSMWFLLSWVFLLSFWVFSEDVNKKFLLKCVSNYHSSGNIKSPEFCTVFPLMNYQFNFPL